MDIIYIPFQGPILRQMTKEIALKINIEFTFLNGLLDKSRKHEGPRNVAMCGEHKHVTEEKVGA
jgi:hypothetical protein